MNSKKSTRKNSKIYRPLFDAISRLTTTVSVETVCLRKTEDGSVEVWLTERAPDEVGAGLWHLPGSVVRPGEEVAQVMARLGTREYFVHINNYQLVGHLFHDDPRGWFYSPVYLVELDSKPTAGLWWPVDDLPDPIDHNHRDRVIPMAVNTFTAL